MDEKTFAVGYLFKPSHTEIHYIKQGADADLRKSYEHNFATEKDSAYVGKDEGKAKSFIVDLVSRMKVDREYDWTPVLVDVQSNTFQRFLHDKWQIEAIELV